MAQRADIYLRQRLVFATTMSRTDAGLWVGGLVPLVGSVDDADEQLGRLVDLALDASTEHRDRPTREEARHAFDSVLEAAGVRTGRRFNESAILVVVERDGVHYSISPKRRVVDRSGIGFTGTELLVRLEAPSNEHLGRALREGFIQAAETSQ